MISALMGDFENSHIESYIFLLDKLPICFILHGLNTARNRKELKIVEQ
jgi:hypothetical protein